MTAMVIPPTLFMRGEQLATIGISPIMPSAVPADDAHATPREATREHD
jgi:hypothetical protein